MDSSSTQRGSRSEAAAALDLGIKTSSARCRRVVVAASRHPRATAPQTATTAAWNGGWRQVRPRGDHGGDAL